MIAGLSNSFARFYTLYIINDFGDSCQACLFPDPAWFGKLVGRAWLLPRKLYSSKRQGWQSLLDKGGSCPGSFIPLSGRGGRACRPGMAPASEALFLKAAGVAELAGQGRLLPSMPFSRSGMVRKAKNPLMIPQVLWLSRICRKFGTRKRQVPAAPGTCLSYLRFIRTYLHCRHDLVISPARHSQ